MTAMDDTNGGGLLDDGGSHTRLAAGILGAISQELSGLADSTKGLQDVCGAKFSDLGALTHDETIALQSMDRQLQTLRDLSRILRTLASDPRLDVKVPTPPLIEQTRLYELRERVLGLETLSHKEGDSVGTVSFF